MNNIMEENLKNMYDAYSKILEKKDQKISDLEAKLAEREKRVKGLAEELENMSSHYSFVRNKLAESYSQEDVDELKQQLAESENENKQLIKALNGETFINYKLPMENAKLKQQLAEKEAEIDKLKRVAYADLSMREIVELKIPPKDQDKISFAVEKLKEVKKLLEKEYRYDVEESDFAVVYEDDVDKIFDNQIKQLKEK